MTDGGDGEFEVHPGDPWSPGWTDDAAEKPKKERPSAPEPVKKRRFGRKRRQEEPVADESPTEEHVAYSEPTVRPEAQFTRARAIEPEAPRKLSPEAPAAPVPPMPAWLSDPPRPEADMRLPVELPAWVGNATVGAEVVAAGFEDALVPPAKPPEGVASADLAEGFEAVGSSEAPPEGVASADLTEAFEALGSHGVSEVELGGEPVAEDVVDPADISRGAFEALRRLEGEEPATLEDPFESLRRLEAEAEAEAAAGQPSAVADEPAITGRYGVASKEAFAVLGDADADDLTDWQAFAGAEAESPTLLPESPQLGTPYPVATPPAPGEEAFDEWAGTEPEPRKKRGFWPFRRRR